jgi:hypothetical protein
VGGGDLTCSTKMLYVFDLSRPCYMSSPLHKLLIMQFPSPSYLFLSVSTYISTSAV